MGGFRKTGVYPINPGAIDDKMSPSGAFQQQKPMSEKESSEAITDSILFTAEQQQLYERRFQEGYDLRHPEYEAWLKVTHPIDALILLSCQILPVQVKLVAHLVIQ